MNTNIREQVSTAVAEMQAELAKPDCITPPPTDTDILEALEHSIGHMLLAAHALEQVAGHPAMVELQARLTELATRALQDVECRHPLPPIPLSEGVG